MAYRIKDLAILDRPRERLVSLGPQALTTAELIRILLRVGPRGKNVVQIGQRLLQQLGGWAACIGPRSPRFVKCGAWGRPKRPS
jgi:DNA repair protein RadC